MQGTTISKILAREEAFHGNQQSFSLATTSLVWASLSIRKPHHHDKEGSLSCPYRVLIVPQPFLIVVVGLPYRCPSLPYR